MTIAIPTVIAVAITATVGHPLSWSDCTLLVVAVVLAMVGEVLAAQRHVRDDVLTELFVAAASRKQGQA